MHPWLTWEPHLPSEAPDLPVTRDGLEPILRSARTNYLVGELYASCGQEGKAKSI